MAYKDPDKQREANRQAKSRQRRRDSRRQPKGMTSPGTTKGMTVDDEPSNVIPKTDIRVIPEQDSKRMVELREFEAIEKASCSEGVTGGDDALPKRGKDIKCFADLPAAAQLAIDTLSENETEHKRRTAIAINYQHQFPDRYHSTGAAI